VVCVGIAPEISHTEAKLEQDLKLVLLFSCGSEYSVRQISLFVVGSNVVI